MNFIGADLGGTKSLLRLFTAGGETIREERYEAANHENFDSILGHFLEDSPPVSAGCFAIAGPVLGKSAEVTNLSWTIDACEITRSHGIATVRLVNDFYGIAASLVSLGADDLHVLQEGELDPSSPRAVLGAGTGLGEALVTGNGGDWMIIATEGGHADFAPSNQLQDDLLLHLREIYGHVSWERVVSGPGIVTIYRFLKRREGADAVLVADASRVAELADQGDETAVAAMDLFIDCYGAEAGNLALKSLCRGGLYLAGGIAARNIARMTDGRFLEALTAKGRFGELMKTIPVYLITNPKAGLIGACSLARSLARD
ncbi:MAG: glucokinase [Thermoanaerobaculia bacterium]|nr:glucokinase [Thermoanaerobaculia bacterium]